MQWKDVDPSTDITFEIGSGGRVSMNLRGTPVTKNWLICTPAFVTCFPKLNAPLPYGAATSVNTDPDGSGAPGQLPISTIAEGSVDQVRRMTLEIDLTERQITNDGVLFRRWMDAFDDRLLEFMHKNQHILGKVGMSREALGAMQKRQFRPRVSKRTGEPYPDSMMVRCKAYAIKGSRRNTQVRPNVFPVFLTDGSTYMANSKPDTDAPAPLSFGDRVALTIRLDGPYCSAGNCFGITWTVTSARSYGQAESAGWGSAEDFNVDSDNLMNELNNLKDMYDPAEPQMLPPP